MATQNLEKAVVLNTWANSSSDIISVSADGLTVERGKKIQETNLVVSNRGWESGVTIYNLHWDVTQRGRQYRLRSFGFPQHQFRCF